LFHRYHPPAVYADWDMIAFFAGYYTPAAIDAAFRVT
jgi:hypothetical protein